MIKRLDIKALRYLIRESFMHHSNVSDQDELDKMMLFAQAYVSLGQQDQEQFREFIGGNYENLCPEAVEQISQKMAGLSPIIERAFEEYQLYEVGDDL